MYFPVGTDATLLSDTSVPVIFVEGEKKAIAVFRWAVLAGVRVLIIGLSGVWNFRGTIEKTVTSNGSKATVKGLLPMFQEIASDGRTVYILFDTNVHTNPDVRAARKEFAKELRAMSTQVYFAELPADCDVNGVDDYLAKLAKEHSIGFAVETVREIIEKAKNSHLMSLWSQGRSPWRPR